MEQFEPFYDTAEAESDRLELLNPINISELFSETGSRLKLDIESKIAENDVKLLEMNDDEVDTTPSPWINKFDDLKKLMQRIPVARYQGKREMICIFKRITEDGAADGEKMGKRKCKIRFTYQMYFEGENLPFDTSYHRNTNIRTIRWDEMFLGIFLSLATMRTGESAEFIIDYRLMHLESGVRLDRVVEPRKKADILFVVKMIDFIEVGDANLNDEAIKDIRDFGVMKSKIIGLKNHALELYEQGRAEQAIRYNHRAIESLAFCETQNDKEIESEKQLRIECYLQLVDCYSKSEKWEKVILMVDKLNSFDEMAKNSEILVKKAIALSKIGDNYDESIRVLRKAQLISPNSPFVAITLDKIVIEREKYKNDTKNMWQRAFKSKNNAKNQLTKENTKFENNFLEMIETFDDLILGQGGLPLAGYTAHELKLIDDILANKANIELKRRKDLNGNEVYTIQKST